MVEKGRLEIVGQSRIHGDCGRTARVLDPGGFIGFGGEFRHRGDCATLAPRTLLSEFRVCTRVWRTMGGGTVAVCGSRLQGREQALGRGE